jgi:uncharacterized OB-fold protein
MAQRSIAPDLFDPDGPVLHGGYSPTSGKHHFPRFARCPYTGADDVEAADLPARGTLFLWTAVTAPPPGYTGPVPFGLGVVELPVGLRVITRITEPDPAALEVGAPMRLVADVVAVDDDGTEVVAWAFEAAQ